MQLSFKPGTISESLEVKDIVIAGSAIFIVNVMTNFCSKPSSSSRKFEKTHWLQTHKLSLRMRKIRPMKKAQRDSIEILSSLLSSISMWVCSQTKIACPVLVNRQQGTSGTLNTNPKTSCRAIMLISTF